MTKILITGGCGFVGANLAVFLKSKNFIVNTIDNFTRKEVKIGMSHRGRLNVLANVLQKSYKRIFNEFAGEISTSEDGAGDVKYHLGASSDREFDGNSVHVSLTDNPSHLEAVLFLVL